MWNDRTNARCKKLIFETRRIAARKHQLIDVWNLWLCSEVFHVYFSCSSKSPAERQKKMKSIKWNKIDILFFKFRTIVSSFGRFGRFPARKALELDYILPSVTIYANTLGQWFIVFGIFQNYKNWQMHNSTSNRASTNSLIVYFVKPIDDGSVVEESNVLRQLKVTKINVKLLKFILMANGRSVNKLLPNLAIFRVFQLRSIQLKHGAKEMHLHTSNWIQTSKTMWPNVNRNRNRFTCKCAINCDRIAIRNSNDLCEDEKLQMYKHQQCCARSRVCVREFFFIFVFFACIILSTNRLLNSSFVYEIWIFRRLPRTKSWSVFCGTKRNERKIVKTQIIQELVYKLFE